MRCWSWSDRRYLTYVSLVLPLLLPSPSLPEYGSVWALGADEHLLPNAVVMQGRKGPNSAINGVYMRDLNWPFPCYRRGGSSFARRPVFLWMEGEWRVGPSPEKGTVWGFAESNVVSPLRINAVWQVWDGRAVAPDPRLRISDPSVIPQVLFLKLSGGAEGIEGLSAATEGMLLQQPGLWDGRPYYRHGRDPRLYLLCAEHEGRWRLGPIPLESSTPEKDSAILYAHSAAALPTEISEPWYVVERNPQSATAKQLLGEDVVRFTVTSSGVPSANPEPDHIAIEGLTVEQGRANGVFRKESELVNYRPVYRKTDSLGVVLMWFDGDWHIGPAMEGPSTVVWAFAACAASAPLAIDAPWQRSEDGRKEDCRVFEASAVIPTTLVVGGEQYAQQLSLCDSRPVYRRDATSNGASAETDVFLYYRARDAEWLLGPQVGAASPYYAYATGGAELRVAPQLDKLVWHTKQPVKSHSPSVPHHENNVDGSLQGSAWWAASLLVVALVGASLRRGSFETDPRHKKSTQGKKKK